jgi:hypothetical protein
MESGTYTSFEGRSVELRDKGYIEDGYAYVKQYWRKCNTQNADKLRSIGLAVDVHSTSKTGEDCWVRVKLRDVKEIRGRIQKIYVPTKEYVMYPTAEHPLVP